MCTSWNFRLIKRHPAKGGAFRILQDLEVVIVRSYR